MKPPQRYGSGRIAVVAKLPEIKAALSQGILLSVLYERLKPSLGITYKAFCQHVARYAGDAKLPVTNRRVKRQPEMQPISAPKPPQTREPVPHVRDSYGRPTFHHTGVPEQGEAEALLGERWKPAERKR